MCEPAASEVVDTIFMIGFMIAASVPFTALFAMMVKSCWRAVIDY